MCNRDKSVHGLNKCGSNLHIAHLLAVEITALQGELLIVHEAKLGCSGALRRGMEKVRTSSAGLISQWCQ